VSTGISRGDVVLEALRNLPGGGRDRIGSGDDIAVIAVELFAKGARAVLAARLDLVQHAGDDPPGLFLAGRRRFRRFLEVLDRHGCFAFIRGRRRGRFARQYSFNGCNRGGTRRDGESGAQPAG
jgi:hypothetical protein